MWDLRPRHELAEPSWTQLNIPPNTEYLIWGVGKNGKLDGDPALDVVLIKLPENEYLIRHRPIQSQPANTEPSNNDFRMISSRNE